MRAERGDEEQTALFAFYCALVLAVLALGALTALGLLAARRTTLNPKERTNAL